jgi:integrase
VQKRAVAAGVEGRKGLHRLRHSCAIQHLLHGGNARTAQEQLGHADLAMVERYTAGLGLEERRRQWQRTSPVEITLRQPTPKEQPAHDHEHVTSASRES